MSTPTHAPTPLPRPPPSHVHAVALPANKTLVKRPLLHAPSAPNATTIYLSSSTSFMAANKRIEKTLRKNPTKPLHVKASGKAIARAIEVAAWWIETEKRSVQVRTGSVGCVDDVVEDYGQNGGKRRRVAVEGKGRKRRAGDVPTEGGVPTAGDVQMEDADKEPGEEVEVVMRMTSTVELVFPVPEDAVPVGRKKRSERNK